MTFRLMRVSTLLFFSGACALTYQVAWVRELRLVFGASTAASAAVLAVFMGGLGVGGALLGKRADRAKNPLALYAHLELAIALVAAVTPLLVRGAERGYLALGGSAALGSVGAAVVRLLLSIVVLGPATFLMGGTLPAASKAVERESDVARQRVAMLYGVNTFGAVAGSLLANFFLLEVFGTQLTQWVAALVNLLVGVIARSLSRSSREPSEPTAATSVAAADADAPAARVAWFPPAAAAVAGATFLLMELVWYRMLGPILGGSSYTFGLILAVALAGIAIGGLLYTGVRSAPTPRLFALTCALEALFIGLPYALGDRLALLSLSLRPLARLGFAESVGVWTIVATIVVLPAAIVSGFQFPVVIGLYGHGANRVGRDVGHAYLANTLGSIVGSLAGGFGLLPVLSAPGCWRLVVMLLAAMAGVGLWVDARLASRQQRMPLALTAAFTGALALLTLLPKGPSALWRHSGIGAGRADRHLGNVDVSTLESFRRDALGKIQWEVDGRESSVAIENASGFSFVVNGKADGHVTVDAPTQVMGGLLGALLHDDPKSALVIGLGTGSTAGWLGRVPSMEHVEAIELEPAILRVARDCAPINADVMSNPKVSVRIGDAREALLTSKDRFDIIFSEPSNPYRAGIASLYTAEYYRAAATRLRERGLFIQWVQAYEVDAWAIGTVATTLREAFGFVSTWQTMGGDLVFVAQREDPVVDVDRMRTRLAEQPYRTATRNVWHTSSAEGVLAHFVGGPALISFLVDKNVGSVNHDDQNFLEFAFARSVGRSGRVDRDLVGIAHRLRADIPQTRGAVDLTAVVLERWLYQLHSHYPLDPPPAKSGPLAPLGSALEHLGAGRFEAGLTEWKKLGRTPTAHHEAQLLAYAAARSNDRMFDSFAALLTNDVERDLLHALFLSHDGARTFGPTVDALERGLLGLRNDPWAPPEIIGDALGLATQVGRRDADAARRLYRATSEPFAVEIARLERLQANVGLGRALDPAECVRALERFSVIPWSRAIMETRVLCTRATNHPSAAEAEADLAALLAMESNSLAELLPSKPEPARSPAARPSGDGDAGNTPPDARDAQAGPDAGDAGNAGHEAGPGTEHRPDPPNAASAR